MLARKEVVCLNARVPETCQKLVNYEKKKDDLGSVWILAQNEYEN